MRYKAHKSFAILSAITALKKIFKKPTVFLNDTDRLDNVLNGALSACVFAGMGSWNDEVAAICEDKNIPQHQYTEVTNALFSAILNVVCGICSY